MAVGPGGAVLIPPGVRHRAMGRLTILNIVVPPSDPADGWLDRGPCFAFARAWIQRNPGASTDTEPVWMARRRARGGPVAIGQSKALAGRFKIQIGSEARRVRDGAARSTPHSRVGPRAC
jgi:hypothetical protein